MQDFETCLYVYCRVSVCVSAAVMNKDSHLRCHCYNTRFNPAGIIMHSLMSHGLDTGRWQKKRRTEEDGGVSRTDAETSAANHVPLFHKGLEKLSNN